VDEDILSMGKVRVSSAWTRCSQLKDPTLTTPFFLPIQGPHSVEIDLMQPLDVNKSPKVHVPALNHIGLWIDNLPAAVEYLVCII
jgi:hypothetical protein